MNKRNRHEDWIDDDEYPDDHDVEEFGEESPPDHDPLTIGYVGERPSFWTTKRIFLLILVLLIVAALLLPQLLPIFRG